MPRGSLPALAMLDVADPPEVWRRLGFTVGDDDTCRVGDVRIRLLGTGAGRGLVAWGLRARAELPAQVDGIPTSTLPAGSDDDTPPAPHPNGVTHLDHVVIETPDIARTLAALEALGLEVRRTREAGTPERPLRQAFLWAGDTLLEVAGPLEPRGRAAEGAHLWGLMAVAGDLEPILASPDRLVGSVHDAVQPGRRIVTVRREAGSSVPLAFMTPHIGRATPEETGTA